MSLRFRLLVLVCAVALPASHAIPVDPSSSPSGQISTFQQPSPVSFASSSPSASMSPSVGMMQPTAVAGRVVEPVAFSAVRASDKSRKSNSKIFFDTTLSDIGFGWNSRSSEFICFYPGSYFFTFTAISDSGSHFKWVLISMGYTTFSLRHKQQQFPKLPNCVWIMQSRFDEE